MTLREPPKVFVVDDEGIIASTLNAILNQSGFRALSFTNPLEALEVAVAEKPDLLISDVMMPQLSGVELAIQLRGRCPDCRILLFSGQAATNDLLADARKSGHDFELLSKPIHPSDLLAAIRQFDGIHPAGRETAPLRAVQAKPGMLHA